jgi:hypothetical protein
MTHRSPSWAHFIRSKGIGPKRGTLSGGSCQENPAHAVHLVLLFHHKHSHLPTGRHGSDSLDDFIGIRTRSVLENWSKTSSTRTELVRLLDEIERQKK